MATTQLWRYVDAWRARQRFHVSQAALAREVGVKPTALSQWKLGQSRPAPANLRSLSSVIGVPYEVLLDALLIDMGYRQEYADGSPAPTSRAGESPAENVVQLCEEKPEQQAAHPMKGAQSRGRRLAKEQDEQGES